LLKEAGIENVEKLANASIDELVKIKGIGPSTAEKYITNAKKLLGK
ncbi:MAG: helix-hairpin-helix domain-containing protein, partial [Candidatus Heimdallarchaeaceae archaeon]